ncbi:MAG: glycosyltransferase [Candidatus Paceibacterota bacterium]
MKRVAVFTTAYLPLIGGAEVAIFEITKRFSDFHFDIYTARLNRHLPKVEEVGNVTIYRLGLGFYFDKWWLAFGGHRLALVNHRQQPYDFIWAVIASFGGLAARHFKRRKQAVPFLLTLQEGDDLAGIERKGRLLLGAFVDIFHRADRIQAISHYLAAWAERLGATAPIEVIPNGVDLQVFTKRPTQSKNNPSVIVTASRLTPKNGVHHLITAVGALPFTVRLIIAGVGRQEKFLRRQVNRLGLTEQVDFVGRLDHDKLADLLAEADLFVRPSLSEGLGNAFLEAMAVGLPVIGTPVGGIPDFLKIKETGFMAKPADPADLARVMAYVLDKNNQAEVVAVAEAGCDLVVKKYDWDTIALKFRNLFSQL